MHAGLVLLIAGLLTWTLPSFAQIDESAKERLTHAAQVWQDTTSLSFRIKSYAEGSPQLKGFNPDIQASVIMLKNEQTNSKWWTLAQGTSLKAGEETPLDFTIFTDSQNTKWIDKDQKKVMYTPARRANGPGAYAMKFIDLPRTLGNPPFKEDFKASEIKLVAPQEFDGVMCDVIHVRAAKTQLTIWYIGVADGLVRKMEKRLEGTGMFEGGIVLELLDLKHETQISPDAFAIETPPGYILESTIPKAATSTVRPSTSPNKTSLANRQVIKPIVPMLPLAQSFSLKDDKGAEFSLIKQKGRVTVLCFRGSWCGPCAPVEQALQKLSDDLKDTPVDVLLISCRDRDNQRAVSSAVSQKVTLTMLLDGAPVARNYRIRAYPTVVIITPDSKLALRQENFLDEDKALASIRAAIAKHLPASKPAPAQ